MNTKTKTLHIKFLETLNIVLIFVIGVSIPVTAYNLVDSGNFIALVYYIFALCIMVISLLIQKFDKERHARKNQQLREAEKLMSSLSEIAEKLMKDNSDLEFQLEIVTKKYDTLAESIVKPELEARKKRNLKSK